MHKQQSTLACANVTMPAEPKVFQQAPQTQSDFQAPGAAAQEAARVRSGVSPSRAAKVIIDSKSPTRAGRRKPSSASTSWNGSTKVTDDTLAGQSLTACAVLLTICLLKSKEFLS